MTCYSAPMVPMRYTTLMRDEEVLRFWFEETSPALWFTKDSAFDRVLTERFGALHHQATQGECWGWRTTPRGRLAEVIVLDQFSRNIHRDTPQAFAHDGMALVLAQEAIAVGADQALRSVERGFLYMPYQHSESLLIHQTAVELYRSLDDPEGYEWELKHQAIIERFGRYPHRNAILGRASTAEEVAFLKEPGSSF